MVPKCPRVLQLATVLLIAAIMQINAASIPLRNDENKIFHQVAIRVRQPVMDKIEDYHLCSGLIVDPSYVVTTAKCLEMSPTTNDSEIYVAAGHLSNEDSSLQFNYTIASIVVHPDFRALEWHDIALIKLDDMLPVSSVAALPLVEDSRNNCSVIIRNHEVTSYFKLVHNLRVAPSQYCAPANVDDDDFYCSQYPMDANWCSVTEDQLKTSDDLGSALICNSVFVGVLSEIQAPQDTFNFPCQSPRTTFAVYTSLDEHRDWMYRVMGREPIIPTTTEEDDNDSATVRQSMGVLLITAAVFVYFFM